MFNTAKYALAAAALPALFTSSNANSAVRSSTLESLTPSASAQSPQSPDNILQLRNTNTAKTNHLEDLHEGIKLSIDNSSAQIEDLDRESLIAALNQSQKELQDLKADFEMVISALSNTVRARDKCEKTASDTRQYLTLGGSITALTAMLCGLYKLYRTEIAKTEADANTNAEANQDPEANAAPKSQETV
jgi:hypothetical protein